MCGKNAVTYHRGIVRVNWSGKPLETEKEKVGYAVWLAWVVDGVQREATLLEMGTGVGQG
jgi:hypothetical protein